MTEVVVRVRQGKTIHLGKMQVKYRGEVTTPDALVIREGELIAVPLRWYERNASDVELVLPPEEPEKAPAPGAAAPEPPTPAKEPVVDPKRAKLEAMTYADLKKMASLAGVKWSGTPRKAWLIDKLMEQG